MKQLLLSMALALAAQGTYAQEKPLTLREHMRAMGYILDEVFSRANESKNYAEAAERTRQLRTHLVQSISLYPQKFSTLRELEKNAAVLEYHQLMARVIYLSASLEQTFAAGDEFHFVSGSRQDDIRNLLHEINVLIGKAHRKFRD